MTAPDPYLPGLTDVRSRVTSRSGGQGVVRAPYATSRFGSATRGEVLGGGDATSPVPEVLDPDRLHITFGGSPEDRYGRGMAGEWRAAVGKATWPTRFTPAARLATILPRPLLRLRGLVDVALPHRDRKHPRRDREPTSPLITTSNDLFATFLDETMTYSSALFDESRPWPNRPCARPKAVKRD